MRFTVLGASGFIGAHLAANLRSEGHEVLTLGRGVTSFGSPLGHVFYCIGLTADFRTRPFDTVAAHVSLLSSVLQSATFESLVYLSSTRVYRGASFGREDEYLEVSPNEPSDIYNISKLMGESLCLNCGLPNVRAVRLSNVIGNDTGSNNFVYDIARSAIAGHVKLRSDPASAKDYIHIDDVVSLLKLITTGGRHRLYNAATGVKISNRQWLDKLFELTNCKVEIEPGSPRLDFPDIDVSRITDEFNLSLKPVLDELPNILRSLNTSV